MDGAAVRSPSLSLKLISAAKRGDPALVEDLVRACAPWPAAVVLRGCNHLVCFAVSRDSGPAWWLRFAISLNSARSDAMAWRVALAWGPVAVRGRVALQIELLHGCAALFVTPFYAPWCS